MRIAIVGYGKMGRLLDDLAPGAGIEVGGRFDAGQPLVAGDYRVAVDFTTPNAVVENVRRAAGLGVNLVVGTTGWYEQLEAVRAAVESSGIGMVYGANFSIGVNLFFQIARQAAGMLASRGEYDPYIIEMHHRHKKDAPSGTALKLAKLVGDAYGRNTPVSSVPVSSVPVSSVRAGEIPGTHQLSFDSEADTITLTHTARSRKGFALGALEAAKWIEGRSGLYAFEEIPWEAPR
jgi:4-hydroxy-tetrahydrodipicolinate reductase